MQMTCVGKFIRYLSIICLGFVLGSCKARKEESLSAVLSTPQAGTGTGSVLDYLAPNQLKQLALKEFERGRISVGASLFSLNLTDLAAVTGAYQVTVQQAGQGVQQRHDRWKLGTDILPGTLLQDAAANSLPISIRIRAGREITYIRNFPDKISALKALPKSPLDLPFNAEKALKMAPGDFVSLPVYMGMTLALERGVSTQPFSVNASAGVFWRGEYRYNIIRQDNDHVRLKVAPSDARGFQLSTDVCAKLDVFGYGPFGLVNIDSNASRILGFDFFKFSLQKTTKGEKMVVDYVFDLRHPDARIAYDAIMQKVLSVKAGALATQGLSGSVDAETVFSDLTPAEYLSTLDENQPADRKRVARVFRGANFYNGADAHGHLGTRLLRWESNKSLTFNWLNSQDFNGTPQYYIDFTFFDSRKQSSWLSPLREQNSISAKAVFTTDERWDAPQIRDLFFDLAIDDNEVNANEKNDVRASYRVIFGDYYDVSKMDQALTEMSGQKLQSNASFAIPKSLFETMRASAQADPELYEKQIWYALYMITPRFEGRFGPRSSGSATTPVGWARNFVKNSVQAVRTTMRSVINLNWEGIHGTTVSNIVNYSLNMPRNGEIYYLSGLFKMFEYDESAREIIPAYLLTLAQLYNIQPYVTMNVETRNSPPFNASWGVNDGEKIQSDVSSAFYHINNLGYER